MLSAVRRAPSASLVLRSAWFWAVMGGGLLLILCLMPVLLPLHRWWRPTLPAVGRLWGRLCLWAGGVRLERRGLEHLRPEGGPYVLMANHQSLFDIFALLTLPVAFRWTAKRELFRYPVFGWCLRLAGAISVDRSDGRRALDLLRRGRRGLRRGESLLVFPEGTRSDGRLLPFREGGFLLALRAGAPIVPIALRGGAAILPAGHLLVRPGPLTMVVEPPVDTRGYSLRNRTELVQRVRSAIARHLEA